MGYSVWCVYVMMCTGWCNALEAGPELGAKGYGFFIVKMVLSSEGEGMYNMSH